MTLVPHLLNLLCKREIGANYSFRRQKFGAAIARRSHTNCAMKLSRFDHDRVQAIIRVIYPRTAANRHFGRMRIGMPMWRPLAGMATRQNFRWKPSGHISISNRCYAATARPCGRGRKLSRYRNVRSPAGGSSILSRRHAVQCVRVDAAARQPLWY